jgi:predicted GNAT family N-acyltransferase
MKINKEDYYFTIEYSIIRALGSNDIESFVTKKIGTIIAHKLFTDEEKSVNIGSVVIKNFHIGAMMNNNIDPLEVFDLESQDFEIYQNIFDSDRDLIDDVNTRFETIAFDICVLDRIVINPEWRGLGITQMVIDDITIQNIEGCRFIVLKSFPLQHEGGEKHLEKNLKLEEFKGLEKDEKKAQKRLNKYYKDLGFINITKVSKNILFKSL